MFWRLRKIHEEGYGATFAEDLSEEGRHKRVSFFYYFDRFDLFLLFRRSLHTGGSLVPTISWCTLRGIEWDQDGMVLALLARISWRVI